MDHVILVIKVSLDRAANNLQNERSFVDINKCFTPEKRHFTDHFRLNPKPGWF